MSNKFSVQEHTYARIDAILITKISFDTRFIK
jgi:hypothetical protein